MLTVTQVIFEDTERRVLEEARLAAPVGYRDDADTLRLLGGIADAGQAVSLRRLRNALAAYAPLTRQLETESEESYWLGQITADVPNNTPETMRPEFMARTLAQARRAQHLAVVQAIVLLTHATELATDEDSTRPCAARGKEVV